MNTNKQIPDPVRRAEEAIDTAIGNLSIWSLDRDALLLAIVNYYRDAIEQIMLSVVHAKLFGDALSVARELQREHHIRAGVFQALKWTMLRAKLTGQATQPTSANLIDLVDCGANYEVFVDALKMARCSVATLVADEGRCVVSVYQGRDLTGQDQPIVGFQQATRPFQTHWPLTLDSDQLTSRWTAGDFRAVMHGFLEKASESEVELLNLTLAAC